MVRPFFLVLVGMLLLGSTMDAKTAVAADQVEPELYDLIAELDARWNARDAGSMSQLFTLDVDFRIYGTRHHRSREEIRRHYAQAFSKLSAEIRHATTLTTVRLLAPGLTLLDGEVVVGKPGAPEGEMRYYYYSAVALKQDGAWLFHTFRVALQTRPGG